MPFPVDSTYVDGNGKQLLLSSNVVALEAVDLAGSSFWSPPASFTGYAADGNYYSSGEATGDRASWATESDNDHRGALNRFPQTLLIVLTDTELSIVDGSTMDLFIRFHVVDLEDFGSGDPGIFLEWIEDESLPALGTALGIEGDTLTGVTFADGRIVVSSDNATRVFDFREDRAYAFRDGGHYRYRLDAYPGLDARNMPGFFGSTVYAETGPSIGNAVNSFVSGTSAYYVVGSQTGVVVFRWSANGISALQTQDTVLGGESLGHDVTSDGNLYVLVEYPDPDTGMDRLKIVRSVSEWQSVGGSFSGSVHQVSIPVWVGGAGKMDVHGETIYVGAGSGIWRTNRYSLTSPELVYGKTLTASEPVSPLYEVLTQNDEPIQDIRVDATTGQIGVLYGDILQIVNLGTHQVEAGYSTGPDSSPTLPSSPVILASFTFDAGDV